MLGLLREVIWHINIFKGGNLAEGYLKMRGKRRESWSGEGVFWTCLLRASALFQRVSSSDAQRPRGSMGPGLPPPSQELLPALLSVGNPQHLGRGDSEHLEETETITQACKGACPLSASPPRPSSLGGKSRKGEGRRGRRTLRDPPPLTPRLLSAAAWVWTPADQMDARASAPRKPGPWGWAQSHSPSARVQVQGWKTHWGNWGTESHRVYGHETHLPPLVGRRILPSGPCRPTPAAQAGTRVRLQTAGAPREEHAAPERLAHRRVPGDGQNPPGCLLRP